jgi:hypothetical protein
VWREDRSDNLFGNVPLLCIIRNNGRPSEQWTNEVAERATEDEDDQRGGIYTECQ